MLIALIVAIVVLAVVAIIALERCHSPRSTYVGDLFESPQKRHHKLRADD